MNGEPKPQRRRLTKRLAVGLLLLPIVFVWLLFRRGHSINQRIGGLALVAVGIAISVVAIGLVHLGSMAPEERQKLAGRAALRAEARRHRDDQEAASEAVEALETATCSGDIQCAAKRAQSRALPRCSQLIEDAVRYRHEWTDGLGSRFFRAEWSHQDVYTKRFGEKRIIEFRGNSLRVENAFGAFRKVTYECDFDPLEGDALAVRISP